MTQQSTLLQFHMELSRAAHKTAFLGKGSLMNLPLFFWGKAPGTCISPGRSCSKLWDNNRRKPSSPAQRILAGPGGVPALRSKSCIARSHGYGAAGYLKNWLGFVSGARKKPFLQCHQQRCMIESRKSGLGVKAAEKTQLFSA